MQLREIRLSDLPTLAKLNQSIFKDSDEKHSLAVLRYSFKIRIRKASLIAVEEGRIIGGIFVERSVTFTNPESAYIRSLFVDPSHKGKRIGEALISSAVDALRGYGIKHISLVVHPDNEAAIALYRKTGFSLSRLQYSKGL